MGNSIKLRGRYFHSFIFINLIFTSISAEISKELEKLNERLTAINSKLDATSRVCISQVDVQVKRLNSKTVHIEREISALHTLIINHTEAVHNIQKANDNFLKNLNAKFESVSNWKSEIEKLSEKLSSITRNIATPSEANDGAIKSPNYFNKVLAQELETQFKLNFDRIQNASCQRGPPDPPLELNLGKSEDAADLDLTRLLDLVSVVDNDSVSETVQPRTGEGVSTDPSQTNKKKEDTGNSNRLFRQLWRQFLKPIFKVTHAVEKVEKLILRRESRNDHSMRKIEKIEATLTELSEKMLSSSVESNLNSSNSLARRMETAFHKVDGQFDNVEQRILYQNSLTEKLFDMMRVTTTCSSDRGGTNVEQDQELARDCQEILQMGATNNGVYNIQVEGKRLDVFCDLKTMGGGWLTIQRRDLFPGKQENFSRNWQDYKIGFGNVKQEFWLGNDNIYALTSSKDVMLLVELQDFEGNNAYSLYNKFRLESEGEKFRLLVGEYSGNASDSLSAHDGKPFSTYDQIHDEVDPCCSCALTFEGGWWFYACFEAHLNGPYQSNPTDNGYFRGIIWEHWKGDYSLKYSEMKIRPLDVTKSSKNDGSEEPLVEEDP